MLQIHMYYYCTHCCRPVIKTAMLNTENTFSEQVAVAGLKREKTNHLICLTKYSVDAICQQSVLKA